MNLLIDVYWLLYSRTLTYFMCRFVLANQTSVVSFPGQAIPTSSTTGTGLLLIAFSAHPPFLEV